MEKQLLECLKNEDGRWQLTVRVAPAEFSQTLEVVWQLCKDAGVTMTNVGATYPYRNDPNDSNLRIAPSLPPVEELEKAMEVLTISLKLSALEKLLNK